ncbi:hypothetical protein LWI28_003461 [Acer negundo]|uniref:Uncharacterized protein n=1 Tax=Acer negundo TaxID=4023 RepID=A0AAD5NVN5_ACENE|nr:hypothetical protein LWI28_003461 [Acer negundo]KAK4852811.1 hypothetical protein QYF36_027233 [Acer negundo]
MEHEDAGQRHEEEKEDAHNPTVEMLHRLWGNNRALTSQGQTSSSIFTTADQEIIRTRSEVAFKITAQPDFKVSEPSTEEEKENAHEPAIEMEHEDIGQWHEEKKENAHDLTGNVASSMGKQPSFNFSRPGFVFNFRCS